MRSFCLLTSTELFLVPNGIDFLVLVFLPHSWHVGVA